MKYSPPYSVTSAIREQAAAVCERLESLRADGTADAVLQSGELRRASRLRAVQATLAIEGGSLSLEQVAAVADGRAVDGPPRDIREAHGTLSAYEKMAAWQPHRLEDMLAAHALLKPEPAAEAGRLRTGGVGVFSGGRVVHMAPPAHLVHGHMCRLLSWLMETDEQLLIAACVFHWEFEFIHPFFDGNGRMGRPWQTLVLGRWNPLLACLPVEAGIYARQQDYYGSLSLADTEGEATVFVEYMLEVLEEALSGLQGGQQGSRAGERPS
ncbi:MAG: Fic family protein [Desulfovibrionaceae bacterium]|nr:Fic family protein [Desulfovibrionaceae bacterium]